jgi:hypothetical protein
MPLPGETTGEEFVQILRSPITTTQHDRLDGWPQRQQRRHFAALLRLSKTEQVPVRRNSGRASIKTHI